MYDFKACLDLIKAVSKASREKAVHDAIRPCLADKEAMQAYANVMGYTRKAHYTMEQKASLITVESF